MSAITKLRSEGIDIEVRNRLRADLLAERARRSGSRSFSAFVKQAWPIFEPAPLVWGWHMDAICDHLEALARGEIRRLVVNVPPRSSKSSVAAILFSPWLWSWDSRAQFMYLSYSATLSVEHSVKSRQVIESQWYRETHMRGWSLREDQNVKHDFVNTAGGRRRATSISGGITGHGADLIVADDPLSAEEAYSKAARDRAWRVLSEAFSTRFNDPKTGRGLCVMQRFHEDDPTRHLVDAGWTTLMIPTEFEPERRCSTTRMIRVPENGAPAHDREETFWSDPRTEAGELLFPDRVPREEVDRIKASLGPFAYAAQHQQRPSPEGGGLFPVGNWRFWKTDDATMERLGLIGGSRPRGCHEGQPLIVDFSQIEEQVISVDATFRETRSGSYVVIQVWGKLGAARLLLYRVRRRMDFADTVDEMLRVIRLFPEARRKLIEGKANGDAIISTLERKHGISGLEAVAVTADKIKRAMAAQPYQHAGNIHLPDGAPWAGEHVQEHAEFPNGSNDDQVDAQSQAIIGMEREATTMGAWGEAFA